MLPEPEANPRVIEIIKLAIAADLSEIVVDSDTIDRVIVILPKHGKI